MGPPLEEPKRAHKRQPRPLPTAGQTQTQEKQRDTNTIKVHLGNDLHTPIVTPPGYPGWRYNESRSDRAVPGHDRSGELLQCP